MMNRRSFIGVVGGIFGFLGFAKISNNANGGNSKNLPVVKFNTDDGYCCNQEEIFKGIPFRETSRFSIASYNEKIYERECHAWIEQKDSVWCLTTLQGDKDARPCLLWGEVDMVERKESAVGYSSNVYGYFKECPQSFKTTFMKRSRSWRKSWTL